MNGGDELQPGHCQLCVFVREHGTFLGNIAGVNGALLKRHLENTRENRRFNDSQGANLNKDGMQASRLAPVLLT